MVTRLRRDSALEWDALTMHIASVAHQIMPHDVLGDAGFRRAEDVTIHFHHPHELPPPAAPDL